MDWIFLGLNIIAWAGMFSAFLLERKVAKNWKGISQIYKRMYEREAAQRKAEREAGKMW